MVSSDTVTGAYASAYGEDDPELVNVTSAIEVLPKSCCIRVKAKLMYDFVAQI